MRSATPGCDGSRKNRPKDKSCSTRVETRILLCAETKFNKQRSWKPPVIKRERTCPDKKPCRGHGNRVFLLRDRYAGYSALQADETPAGTRSIREKKESILRRAHIQRLVAGNRRVERKDMFADKATEVNPARPRCDFPLGLATSGTQKYEKMK